MCSSDEDRHSMDGRNRTSGIVIMGKSQEGLEIGLTRAKDIAGAIQRKEEYLKPWVNAYNLYKDKCISPNNIKGMLKDRLRESWHL